MAYAKGGKYDDKNSEELLKKVSALVK